MTPTEIVDARKQLNLTQAGLADVLGMSANGRRTVSRWEMGEIEISGAASLAIRYMLKYGLPEKALRVP